MIKLMIATIQVTGIMAATMNATLADPAIQASYIDVTPEAERGAAVEPDALAIAVDDIDPVQHQCLAKNIYFEARNQTYMAQVAVGNVTMNRVQSPDFPDTICGVVQQGPLDGSHITRNRCQFSWWCDGKSDVAPVNDTPGEVVAWSTATLIAELIMRGLTQDVTNGGTYYHADYVDPYWNKVYTLVEVIGVHSFYKHY